MHRQKIEKELREKGTNELLDSFVAYCKAHPEQRFWQALRNWAGAEYIFVGKNKDNIEDTFYWEDKLKIDKR
jgi:predicted lipoprotein